MQHILEGFVRFDRDVYDRPGGFNPDEISPAARRFLSTYEERGIMFRIMGAMRYIRWAAFLTILLMYADTEPVNHFAREISLFGSASVTGYAIGLILFIILWACFFIVQSATIGFLDRRLQNWFGEEVVDEAMHYIEKRAAANGYLPLMKRFSWVANSFANLHARRSDG